MLSVAGCDDGSESMFDLSDHSHLALDSEAKQMFWNNAPILKLSPREEFRITSAETFLAHSYLCRKVGGSSWTPEAFPPPQSGDFTGGGHLYARPFMERMPAAPCKAGQDTVVTSPDGSGASFQATTLDVVRSGELPDGTSLTDAAAAKYRMSNGPSSPGQKSVWLGPELGDLPLMKTFNVARGKPATQSSTDWSGVASRAVDGNTDGSFFAGSVTHTAMGPGQWWQVDLGAVYHVDEVTLWNRIDCCVDRLRDFDVQTSSDGMRWISHHNPGTAQTRTDIAINGIARYVRIVLNSANPLSLAEVEVWGHTAWLPLVAKHSQMCLDIEGQSTAQYAKVVQAPSNGSDSQRWAQVDAGNGIFTIINKNSGLCLSSPGWYVGPPLGWIWPKDNGEQLIQHECSGIGAKVRRVESLDGYASFELVHSAKCVAVPSSSLSPGTKLIQWTCMGIPDQSFVSQSVAFGSAPAQLPGTIEAENFDVGGEGIAYHEWETGFIGFQSPHRPREGIWIVPTQDSAGGYEVGPSNYGGGWLNYTVDIQASLPYTVVVRAVTYGFGASETGAFHIEVDGVDVTGRLEAPITNSYMDIVKTNVPLPAGRHTLRLVMEGTENARTWINSIHVLAEVDNIARGKPATQSSTTNGGVASRAVDGNVDGIWINGSVTHTAPGPGQWWQVDLGSLLEIDLISVWNRTDCCSQRLTSFDVKTSADGVTWISHAYPGIAGPVTELVVDAPVRYVKIDLHSANPLSLAEVTVWGNPVSPN